MEEYDDPATRAATQRLRSYVADPIMSELNLAEAEKFKAKRRAKEKKQEIQQTPPDRSCHYCGARGTTRDHIVPRSLLRAIGILGKMKAWENQQNIVPACSKCNTAKGSSRSSCRCPKCTSAWEDLAGEYIASIPVWKVNRKL